jgi:hypothetical protein
VTRFPNVKHVDTLLPRINHELKKKLRNKTPCSFVMTFVRTPFPEGVSWGKNGKGEEKNM